MASRMAAHDPARGLERSKGPPVRKRGLPEPLGRAPDSSRDSEQLRLVPGQGHELVDGLDEAVVSGEHEPPPRKGRLGVLVERVECLRRERSPAEQTQEAKLSSQRRGRHVHPLLTRGCLPKDPVVAQHDVRTGRQPSPFAVDGRLPHTAPEGKVGGQARGQPFGRYSDGQPQATREAAAPVGDVPSAQVQLGQE